MRPNLPNSSVPVVVLREARKFSLVSRLDAKLSSLLGLTKCFAIPYQHFIFFADDGKNVSVLKVRWNS